jgi:hypothetical protein
MSRRTPSFKTETKQRSSWKRTEITPVIPTAGENFLKYFEGYLVFFAVFQICINFFFFTIPRGTPNDVLGNSGF